MDYEVFDLNRDGNDDVLFYVSSSYYSEDEGRSYSNSIIGVALGESSGSLAIFQENTSLVNEGEDYPTVMLEVGKGSFSVSKIYNSYYDSKDTPTSFKFNFSFRKSTNELVWDSKSITEIIEENRRPVPTTKISYFKKNKVLFQNAWDVGLGDDE